MCMCVCVCVHVCVVPSAPHRTAPKEGHITHLTWKDAVSQSCKLPGVLYMTQGKADLKPAQYPLKDSISRAKSKEAKAQILESSEGSFEGECCHRGDLRQQLITVSTKIRLEKQVSNPCGSGLRNAPSSEADRLVP